MSVFSRGIDSVFRILGDAAVYYTDPQGGARAQVTAIHYRDPDAGAQFASVDFKLSARNQAFAKVAEIRKSEVAEPKKNAGLEIEGQRYRVVSEPDLDETGEVWVLGLQHQKPESF